MQQPLRAIYSLLEVCLLPIETDRQVGETDGRGRPAAPAGVHRLSTLAHRSCLSKRVCNTEKSEMVPTFLTVGSLVEVELLWFSARVESTDANHPSEAAEPILAQQQRCVCESVRKGACVVVVCRSLKGQAPLEAG